MNTPLETIVLIGAAGALVAFVMILTGMLRRCLHVCRPNEILIFSGRRRTSAAGRDVGFRIVSGGRAFRVPIIEQVERMDVTLVSVAMSVHGAYSDGGIPLSLTAIANIKLSSDPAIVGNAVERFLGKSVAEVARVGKETLEGHLRGVLATMTPEEVNEDRLKFAERLSDEAGPDLAKLGLQLDTLKIQHVADDRNYLDSIGRSRLAEILCEAEVAESDAIRQAEKAEAEAQARAEVTRTEANAKVQRAQNEARKLLADLTAQARCEEERTEQAAAAARAEAERELQVLRAELEEVRLRADVGLPAQAASRVQTLLAEGDASAVAAKGAAIAEAMGHVHDAWLSSGERVNEIVAAQHIDEVFAQAAATASRMHAQDVSLLDGGDGRTVSAYVAAYPATLRRLLDEVSSLLNVSFTGVLRGEEEKESPSC